MYFFQRLAVSNESFPVFSGPNQLFRAFNCPEKAILERYAVPNELSSSVSPSRGSFFQLFSSADPSKGGQRCPLEGHGAPKVRSAGTKYSQMDAQRDETGVPTTIEVQKQENVKKRAPSRREVDFRGIREVPNKLIRAFKCSQ